MKSILVLGYGIMICTVVMVLPSCDGNSADSSQSQTEGQTADSAIERINARIEDEPKNAEAIAARARYHFENGNLIDATYDLAAAMKLDSINEEYHHLLTDIYMESYKSVLALRTMERAISLFPESVESNLKISELRIILRKYTEAQSSLRTVLELSPQNIEALQLLGVLFKEQGDFDKARNSFQRVVDLDGDNYEAWTMLGNLMDIQGDPMALQCFENAIDIDSTYSQGWHSKAYYLQNHGDPDQAIDIYHRIQRMDSTYTDAYLNAGILYLEKDDYKSAEQEFRLLSDKAPRNPLGPYYLGISFEEREEFQTALGYFNQAASISPRSAQFAEAVIRMEAVLNK
jgi:tetratricopeptide (TPR) repeat protein